MEEYQTVQEALAKGYVVGLNSGKVQPRLEIDEFILDKDVLNLFILALHELQRPQRHTEAFSWFQIAGTQERNAKFVTFMITLI
jgi:hypothetical protein